MQVSRVSEMSFLQSRMTMDAVRMECLAYQERVEQQKEIVQAQAKKIEELEKKLAQKEEMIREHWGEEVESETEES